MKTIVFSAAAAKQLDALPAQARAAVEAGLHRYAVEAKGDVTKLRDREGFRLRIGDYRVLFNETMTVILAVYVGRRQTTTYG